MYFSIIDFLLWLFTMSCIIHISMAVCSTMIQSMIVLSTCQSVSLIMDMQLCRLV